MPTTSGRREFLMEHHDLLRPAIASHNVRSIAHALALAEERGLPRGAFEFQMLYGMAEPIKAALVAMGQRVRVYTPFGELLPGMAYLVRRLLENTSNESFLRAGFHEHLPEEQLLMNPLELLRAAEPKPRAGPRRNSTVPRYAEGARSGRSPMPFSNEPLADFSRDANARRRCEDAALQTRVGPAATRRRRTRW